MAVSNLTQTITIEPLTGDPAPGQGWISGTTKTARKIGEQSLPADYTLTEIQVSCTAITGATGSNPAIIRVYQNGRESSAATIEISGTGYFTQPIALVIASRYGVDRKVIVDAWDPDTGSPNNTCSLKGKVAVTGRPYISIGGATTGTFTAD